MRPNITIDPHQRCRRLAVGAFSHWTIRLLVIVACLVLTLAGCDRGNRANGKVKVAWIGLVCEAPIFSAYENGYFKDEGLDVELVKTDWDSFQAGMSFDRFDATHTLVSYLLKPIEQGLDVKITGGVHKGCLRIQAGIKTNIHTIADLRGKRIAVSTMGSPPMIFASRVLAANGFDVRKDVTWVVYPGELTELALNKGQVDAVADSEPIGSLLLNRNAVRTVVDQMLDAPYKDEFCCAVVISGRLARESSRGGEAHAGDSAQRQMGAGQSTGGGKNRGGEAIYLKGGHRAQRRRPDEAEIHAGRGIVPGGDRSPDGRHESRRHVESSDRPARTGRPLLAKPGRRDG